MRTQALIFFLLMSGICLSQQHVSYTQYVLNRYMINPALAGIQPCGELVMGNRDQWIGFENSPTTYFMSFNTRMNKEDKYPKNFHGWGLNIISDRHGFTTNNYFKLGYAFHLKLDRNYRASFGLYAGIQSFNQNYRSIRIANKAIDPALNDESLVLVYPEISPGAFLYNKNFFVGASLMQGYPTRIKNFGTKENRLSSHYFLNGGYRIRGRVLDYVPSFLFYMSPFASPTMDMTLTFDYDQKIIFGMGSKYLNSGYINFQVRLFRLYNIGYSYEYAFNSLNRVSPNTQEIIISIKSCTTEKKIEKFYCPAYN